MRNRQPSNLTHLLHLLILQLGKQDTVSRLAGRSGRTLTISVTSSHGVPEPKGNENQYVGKGN